jgi:hypothetical protein
MNKVTAPLKNNNIEVNQSIGNHVFLLEELPRLIVGHPMFPFTNKVENHRNNEYNNDRISI